jgi:hypothetical protein
LVLPGSAQLNLWYLCSVPWQRQLTVRTLMSRVKSFA